MAPRGVPWPSRGVPWPLYEEYVLEDPIMIYLQTYPVDSRGGIKTSSSLHYGTFSLDSNVRFYVYIASMITQFGRGYIKHQDFLLRGRCFHVDNVEW